MQVHQCAYVQYYTCVYSTCKRTNEHIGHHHERQLVAMSRLSLLHSSEISTPPNFRTCLLLSHFCTLPRIPLTQFACTSPASSPLSSSHPLSVLWTSSTQTCFLARSSQYGARVSAEHRSTQTFTVYCVNTCKTSCARSARRMNRPCLSHRNSQNTKNR